MRSQRPFLTEIKMSKLLLLALVLTSVLAVSCGSDDKGSGSGAASTPGVVPSPQMK